MTSKTIKLGKVMTKTNHRVSEAHEEPQRLRIAPILPRPADQGALQVLFLGTESDDVTLEDVRQFFPREALQDILQ